MNQNRFKSPVVWSALAAQLLSMLIVLGVIDTGLGDVIEGVIAALLELLVAFGVLNNPTDKSAMSGGIGYAAAQDIQRHP